MFVTRQFALILQCYFTGTGTLQYSETSLKKNIHGELLYEQNKTKRGLYIRWKWQQDISVSVNRPYGLLSANH